ncbi:hypothetical protein ACTD5D_40365 [Nocardia takedensis]|uniref:hypothetical protein n=1 Tax=Nocardia takedensis TaxID=259390 RepID=UPI003F775FF2
MTYRTSRDIDFQHLIEAAATAEQRATLTEILGELDSGWSLAYRYGKWIRNVCSLDVRATRVRYSTAFTVTPSGSVSVASFGKLDEDGGFEAVEEIGRHYRWTTPTELVLNEAAPRGAIAPFVGRWVRHRQDTVCGPELVQHLLAEATEALSEQTRKLIEKDRETAEMRGKVAELGARVGALRASPDALPPLPVAGEIPADWSRVELRFDEVTTSTASFERAEIEHVLAAMGGALAEVDAQDLLMRLVDAADLLERAEARLTTSPHLVDLYVENAQRTPHAEDFRNPPEPGLPRTSRRPAPTDRGPQYRSGDSLS